MQLRGESAKTVSTLSTSSQRVFWKIEALASASTSQSSGATDTCFCQDPDAGFNGTQRSVSRSAGGVSSGELR